MPVSSLFYVSVEPAGGGSNRLFQVGKHPWSRRLSERGIALPQKSGIAAPGVQILMFHVKQQPVEEAPAIMRCSGNKRVAAGLDQHQRQPAGKITRAPAVLPVDSSAPLAGRALNAQHVAGFGHLRHHRQGGGAVPNDRTHVAGAERAPARQNDQRFMNAGFAGPVGANKPVDACAGRQIDIVEIAYTLDRQACKAQGKNRVYSFSGIITWRTESLSGSVMRQELLESLSEMATVSHEMEPSASSR